MDGEGDRPGGPDRPEGAAGAAAANAAPNATPSATASAAPGAARSPRAPDGRRARKRATIVQAATRLFLEGGFEATSMDALAAAAGVSKRTLYAHFPAKERLFEAIVTELCEEILEPLRRPETAGRPPRATLLELGRTFLGVMLSPAGLDLYRTVLAEAKRFPQLGALFYRCGHQAAAARLAAYLRDQQAQGRLRPLDPAAAAEAFLTLAAGFAYERALLCPGTQIAPAEVERWLTQAVDLFLDGLAQPPADQAPG